MLSSTFAESFDAQTSTVLRPREQERQIFGELRREGIHEQPPRLNADAFRRPVPARSRRDRPGSDSRMYFVYAQPASPLDGDSSRYGDLRVPPLRGVYSPHSVAGGYVGTVVFRRQSGCCRFSRNGYGCHRSLLDDTERNPEAAERVPGALPAYREYRGQGASYRMTAGCYDSKGSDVARDRRCVEFSTNFGSLMVPKRGPMSDCEYAGGRSGTTYDKF